MTQAQTTQTKAKNGIAKLESSASDAAADIGETVKERLESARDALEDVKEKAEAVFAERPYLVPLTAGAVGFGLGMLFGSRLARFAVVTVVGAVVSDVVGGEAKRLAGAFMKDMQSRLTEGEDEGDVADES